MHDGTQTAAILITFGGLFLLGLVADLAGRHTPLPRVTLLLLAGFAIGPNGLDWLPAFTADWFPVLTSIALSMIGFLLGQNLTARRLRALGVSVLGLSVGEVLTTALLVCLVLHFVVGVRLDIALLLAGIAPATAPAATLDVVREAGARGRFTDTLLGVVAIDDAWGLLVFTVLLAVVIALQGTAQAGAVLLGGAADLGGAILLGLSIGLPMALITGRVRPGEPTQAEALGLVMLTAGLAALIGVSYLLAAIVLGVTVANVARHHTRPFHAIEGFEWPFLVLFFLLAGAGLRVDQLRAAGDLAGWYIGLRVLGRLAGTRIGGQLTGSDPRTVRWIGIALLPQAGVAIGMALIVAQRFPAIGEVVLPVVLASTVVFEVVGPVATRFALRRVGEASPAGPASELDGDGDDPDPPPVLRS